MAHFAHVLDKIPLALHARCQSMPSIPPSIESSLPIRAPEQVFHYDYQLEKKVVAECLKYERLVQEEQDRLQQSQDREQQRKKEAERKKAHKLAPGYTPSSSSLQATKSQPSESPQRNSSHSQSAQPAKVNRLDLLEFEQGLPPPNPWDTPETVHDQLDQLREGLAGARIQSTTTSSTAATPPAYQQATISKQEVPPLPARNAEAAPPLLPRPSSKLNLPTPTLLAKPQVPTGMPSQPKPPVDFTMPQQTFFLSLLKAGFPSTSVEVAIRLYDVQEKNVVDYCLHVDQLVSDGFASKEIHETYRSLNAISKIQPGHPKVKAYLSAVQGVREMGFQDETAVKRALATTDPDLNKPLPPMERISAQHYANWTEQALNRLL